ncbi:MAG: hypothetical protein CMH31_05935 [Micavibrio sp.]|nr:hypothetical protein [Micavibrio sp.]|tara:strand:- start:1829 stop:2992 length:1164 start_codon:yes stop_codon:yes gene_type:complete
MQDEDNNLELDDDFLSDDFDDLALDDFDDEGLDEGVWDDDELSPPLEAPSQQEDALGLSEKKKPALSFNTLVIIGAVILGVIVLYFQVFKGNKPNMDQSQRFVSSLGIEAATSTLDGNEENSLDNTEDDGTQEIDSGFLNDDMDNLPEEHFIELEPDELPMPTPVSQDMELADEYVYVADSLEFTTETQEYSTDSISPVETVETVGTSRSVEPAIEIEEIATIVEKNIEDEINDIVVNNTDAIKQDHSSDGATLSAIDQKLALFLDRMDDLENKIDVIEDASNQRAALLEESVKSLEGKVKSLKAAPVSKRSTQKASPVKKALTKKPSVKWKLKAAQPDKAWISQKGSSVIKPIKVGDNIDGLGQIQSIQLVNGKWIVLGTGGKITQ